MLRALSLAIGDLGDPRILGVLIRSLIVTLLVFAGLGLVLAWALNGADPCGWLIDDTCPLGLPASGLGAIVLTVLGICLLFPAVALGVIAAYMDRIVGIVETRHYPRRRRAAARLGARGPAGRTVDAADHPVQSGRPPFYLLLLLL